MLENDRVDVSEETNIKKTNGLRKYIISHQLYFLEINFRFHWKVCDCCQDLMQEAMSFNYVAISYVKRNDYVIHFWYIERVKV